MSRGLPFAAQCSRGGLESALRMGGQQRVAVAVAAALWVCIRVCCEEYEAVSVSCDMAYWQVLCVLAHRWWWWKAVCVGRSPLVVCANGEAQTA